MQNSLYVCVFLYLNVAHAFAETGRDPCQEYDTSILVSGESSDLFLCLKGRSVENYTVSFGKRGLGNQSRVIKRRPWVASSWGALVPRDLLSRRLFRFRSPNG